MYKLGKLLWNCDCVRTLSYVKPNKMKVRFNPHSEQNLIAPKTYFGLDSSTFKFKMSRISFMSVEYVCDQ